MLDGKINPNSSGQISNNGEGYKNGIFIHSTWKKNSARGGTSVGCLLISTDDRDDFNKAMKGVKRFQVQVIRNVNRLFPLQGVTGPVSGLYISKSIPKYD
jgi:hypothetical protein